MEQQPPSSKRKLDVASMAELPEHVIYSILLKSSVKSLKRFYSVSKRWQEILTSSIFAKQHMKSVREASSSTASSCNVIYSVGKKMRRHTEYVRQFFCHRISSVQYGQQIIQPAMMSMCFSFNNNIDLYFSGLAEYQSCDGLLCMAQINDDVYSTWFIHVCNPATGEHKKLVWPRLFGDMLNRYGFMGFGYEASIDDYKIVVLFPDEWRAQVMSLKENKWRAVDDLKTTSPSSYELYHGKRLRSVYVNGDVYWIKLQQESSKQSYELLRFNLAEESLSLLPFPNDIVHKCKLVTLNESLFLFTWKLDRSMPNIDIWMLQGDTTWYKAGTIPTLEYELGPHDLHPVGFNMSGHVILVNWVDQNLVAYIPQENKFQKLITDVGNNDDIKGEDLYFHFVQMETLLKVPGPQAL